MKQVFENSSAGKYVDDLYLSSTSCYISIAMSVVYCLVYIYLMSAFAEPIAWFCVFVLQVFLAASAGGLWFVRMTQIEDHQQFLLDGTWTVGSKQDESATQTEQALLAGSGLMGLLTIGFFCCVCCGYKSL